MSAQQLVAWSSKTLVPFAPPVAFAAFVPMAISLLTVGFILGSALLIYEVTATKYNRSTLRELLFVVPASLFTGFGVIFLFLAVGIYM
ncbi:NEF1-like protein [Cladochytrium replicatum]|nr:NEF1-like protein [Cladochytrium replicatum]